MKTCPTCEGSKKIQLTIRMNGSETQSSQTCHVCDGSGEVSDALHREIIAENELWCECGNPSGDVEFYNDGEHSEVHKHHYRCRDCGKVTQLG